MQLQMVLGHLHDDIAMHIQHDIAIHEQHSMKWLLHCSGTAVTWIQVGPCQPGLGRLQEADVGAECTPGILSCACSISKRFCSFTDMLQLVKSSQYVKKVLCIHHAAVSSQEMAMGSLKNGLMEVTKGSSASSLAATMLMYSRPSSGT